MEEAAHPPAELLLDHVTWIRELARHLVADRELADDLAQDAWVIALQRPPRERSKARPWFASVLRNLLREHARGEHRRRQREETSARREALESTEELVLKVNLQRELVEIVLELAEPYRSAVLLRFFEGLPPRAIARRLQVPVTTVQSRITRALRLLRERLDQDHGARQRWLGLFAPLAVRVDPPSLLSPASTLLATATQGLFVNAKLVLAFAAVAAAGTVAVLTLREPRYEGLAPDSPSTEVSAGAPSRLEDSAFAGRGAPVEPAEEIGSERQGHGPRAVVAAVPPLQPPFHVVGRLLDAEGAPLAGVGLCDEAGGGELCRSGPGGGFEFETRVDAGGLAVEEGPWVTVRSGVWQRASDLNPVVVAAAAIDLEGRVVDEAGRPLPSARVSWNLPAQFATRFGEVLDATRVRSWAVRSDESGHFLLERLPGVTGAALRATLDGYASEARELVPETQHGLVLVLARPSLELAGSLSGRVLLASGAPAPGARVALGLATDLADDEGLFRLDLARAVTADTLVAVLPGHQVGVLERPGEPDPSLQGPGAVGWPEHVEVRLGPPTLALRGRVVDHRGEPVAGAKLWLAEPTPFVAVGMFPTMREALTAGGVVPAEALESANQLPARDGDSFFDWTTEADGPPSALWYWVATDHEGRFELPGLEERSYRLNVLAEDSLHIATSEPLAPGAGEALIQLPPPELFDKVAGRVVDALGTPLAGVRVLPWIAVVDARSRIFGGRSQVILVRAAAAATTDAQGEFQLDDVPRRGTRLQLSSDDIVPITHELSPADSPRALELVVQARCHFQVILDDPERADSLSLATEDGRRLDVLVLTAGAHNAFTGAPLVGGRSSVLATTTEARRLLLYRGDELVETVELFLRPGDVNEIRP